MSEKILLKDQLFNREKINKIAGEIAMVHSSFDKNNFVRNVVGQFSQLELKARISWIADCLKQHLPQNYQQATNIILASLPAPNNAQLSDNDFGDFIYAPYAEFVAKNGCDAKNLSFSLNALYEITQRFSAEDAIRYFINAFPSQTLATLKKWSKDNHYHVRRLCSEGTRPKLPWSQKLKIDAKDALPILDNLFADSTRYVTRSVANHINDISKIDANLAIDILLGWQKLQKQNAKEMDYIIRHALRSLIKQGNAKALQLLGVSHDLAVEIFNLKVPTQVKINSALEFSFAIKAAKSAQIIADYIIYFQNKAGNFNNKKVFKLKSFAAEEGKALTLSKRHMFRENMTTRKIILGQHEIEIKINGKSCGRRGFLVV